jgi:hypothetical protein
MFRENFEVRSLLHIFRVRVKLKLKLKLKVEMLGRAGYG